MPEPPEGPSIPVYNSQQFSIALHDKMNNYPSGIVDRQTLRKLDNSHTYLADYVSAMLIAIFLMFMMLYV